MKTCVLIDVAIPADRSVTQKEAEKKLKYKGLCVEIRRKWNVNCMVIPVITGTTAMVTNGLKKIGNYTRKTFGRFTTKDSYTWNIAHNTDSTAV